MQRYIILLRGVMPTGKNKVPMAQLRTALTNDGFEQVQTYIQSGNVIATSALDQAAVEQRVHDLIATEFGGDIAVMARTTAQFQAIFERNPYPDADPAQVYFTLLKHSPKQHLVEVLCKTDYAPDQFQVLDDVVYALYAVKYSYSKFNNATIERKLKLAATTRIFNTIAKLVELSKE